MSLFKKRNRKPATKAGRWTVEASFKKGDGDKLPSFEIEAYNGGKLHVDGFPLPVVVDLSGAEFATDQTTILRDHDEERPIGHTEKQTLTATGIYLSGVISHDNDDAREVVTAAGNNYKWKASIGAQIHEREIVPAGRTRFINGQNQAGPFVHAKQSEIHETSVLTRGADKTTTVTIAAKEGREMPTENDNIDQTEAAAVEADRITEISSLCAKAGHPQIEIKKNGGGNQVVSLQAHALRNDWQPREVEREVRLQEREATQPTAPTIITAAGHDGDSMAEVLRASLAINQCNAQPEFLEKHFSDKALQAAHSAEYRGFGVKDIFRTIIRAAGTHCPSNSNSSEFIEAAFNASNALKASGTTTMNLNSIFDDALHKSMLSSFMLQSSTWRTFCKVHSTTDYKPLKMYRLTEKGGFQPLGDDAEFKHMSLTETKRQIEVDDIGVMMTLTRKMIRNDDMSALAGIAERLGRMAGVYIEVESYKQLLAMIGSHFKADNKNYIEGADTVLGVDGLKKAREMFRNRVDSNNNAITASPETLLHSYGPGQEDVANGLYNDEHFAVGVRERSASANLLEKTANQFRGQYKPTGSALLNNTLIKDSQGEAIAGQSDVHWMLLCNPAIYAPVDIAFLDGRQTPIVESAELDFKVLGVQSRAYQAVGWSEGETVGAVYSKGEAGA